MPLTSAEMAAIAAATAAAGQSDGSGHIVPGGTQIVQGGGTLNGYEGDDSEGGWYNWIDDIFGSGAGSTGGGTGGYGGTSGGGGGTSGGGGGAPWYLNPQLIGGVAGLVGGGLGAIGTQNQQQLTNQQLQAIAAQRSARDFIAYLSSRGINFNELVRAHPEFITDWNRARAAGDTRDFETFAVAAIKAAPTNPIWDDIANSTIGSGAQNTTLPAWAVDAQGRPLQPSLLNSLVGIYSGTQGGAARPTTTGIRRDVGHGENVQNPATSNALPAAPTNNFPVVTLAGGNPPDSNGPIAGLATTANVEALFASNPALKAEIVNNMAGGDDTRSPEQWLVDHITQTEAGAGGGTFTTALRQSIAQRFPSTATPPTGPFAPPATPAASTQPGAAGTGNNTTLDPAITALIAQATGAAANIFNGQFLDEARAGLAPVQAARTAQAAAQLARINEQRDLSGQLRDTELNGLSNVTLNRVQGAANILGANVTGAGEIRTAAERAAQMENEANVTRLAQLLGVRREAAQAIYDATSTGAAGVRDARNRGAEDIYGAELLSADTYNEAQRAALARSLTQQTARRLRQGYSGGSSGSNLGEARLTAEYFQRGAGARTAAGVGRATRLSDSGVGYATDMGRAGVGRATTIGQANEQDSMAQLQAAVQLANRLGLAGTNFATSVAGSRTGYATSMAGINEADAIGRLQAQADDARRRLTYLTSDADIARAKADEQNALDGLNLIISNQNRQTSSIGLPFQLANSDLALRTNLANQPYADIDALMRRLSSFGINQSGGANLTTATPQPVINNTQIAGGVLAGLGSAIGSYGNNQTLAQAIAQFGGGGTTPRPASTTPNSGGNYLNSLFIPTPRT